MDQGLCFTLISPPQSLNGAIGAYSNITKEKSTYQKYKKDSKLREFGCVIEDFALGKSD